MNARVVTKAWIRALLCRRFVLVAIVAATTWCAVAGTMQSQFKSTEPMAARAEEEALLAKLAEPSRLLPGKRSTGSVMAQIADEHGVRVMLHRKELENSGIDPDVFVDEEFLIPTGELSLAAALRASLAKHECDLEIRHGLLSLAPMFAVHDTQTQRVYAVGDLVNESWALAGLAGAGRPVSSTDFDPLIELIVTILEPDSWDESGGPGAIQEFVGATPSSDAILLQQTLNIHQQIEDLLAALRTARATPMTRDGVPETTVVNTARSVSDKNVETALATRDLWDWRPVKLPALLHRLAERFKIPIVIDEKSLEDGGIDHERAEVSFGPAETTLENALRIALAKHELDVVVRWGVACVTSRSAAEEDHEIRIYPVGDLVGVYGRHLGVPSTGRLDFDQLTNAITSMIESDSWDENGGPGAIQEFAGDSARQPVLGIANARRVHQQVELFLENLRRAILAGNERRERGPYPLFAARNAAAAERLEKALEAPATWKLNGTLIGAAAEITRIVGVPVLCEPELKDVTAAHVAHKMPLAAALTEFAIAAECIWEVRGETVLFRTDPFNRSAGALQFLIWNVADLDRVRPLRPQPRPRPGGPPVHPLGVRLDQALLDAGVNPEELYEFWADENGPLHWLITLMPANASEVVRQTLDQARGLPAGQALKVMQPNIVPEEFSRRTYRLQGLAGQPPKPGSKPYGRPGSAADVAELLESMVEPESWRSAGGRGQIEVERESLSIRQSGRMHAQVTAFLRALDVLEE